MKRLLALLLILSSLSLASAAGTLTPYCPEGIASSYTQKFTINENFQLSFEGNIYIQGDIIASSYCPEGKTTDFDEPPVSIDYEVEYEIGDNVVLGIKDAYEINSYEDIHSCSETRKQVCFSYQTMDPYSLILECADNEIALNSSLAKSADWMNAQVKVIFECSGSHAEGRYDLREFPWDDGLADYNTLTGHTVIDSFTYDPDKVAKELGKTSSCGDGSCVSGETCSSCPADCACATGATCDSTDPIADENGCVVSETLEICDNELDDDEDGFIDCADGDCSETDACYRVVTGKVLSGGGKPLKNVHVALWTKKAGSAMATLLSTTFTDEYGQYVIDYSSKDPGVVYGDIVGIIVVELKDEAGRFQIVWEDQNANIVYPVETNPFKLPKKENVDIRFTKKQSNLLYDTRLSGSDTNWDASKIYYDAERALTFIQKDLGYDFSGPGNSFPLNIYIYSSKTKGAFYMPSGYIAISPKHSKHTNPQGPENGIWHELIHATQHNKYGQPYVDMRPAADKNHAGFKNSKTGDSFKEGFAEFWPNIISMKLDGDKAGIYGNIWRMELNYNPWMKSGRYEEFAFSSMLWDLIDDNPDGEQLSLYYQDLWDLLMSKPYTTIGQVYDDLIKKWPEYADEIDKLFVAHGLFKDTNEGNKKYDWLEPFWDDNKNRAWDANEKNIDIGTPDDGIIRPHQVYDADKDTIGTPSNYERPNRESKPLDNDSFVKIDSPDDALFKVSYAFTDSSLNYETYGIMGDEPGYVYVEVAPDEYGMIATITIDNYESSDSVTVTNDDYYSEETLQNGYMKIATISLGANKTNYCNNNGICEDSEVSSCGDCSVTTVTPSGGAVPGPSGTTTGTTPGTLSDTITNTLPDIDPMIIAVGVGGLIFLIFLILIIKRLRRPKQPPQQVYYQQQPQQGNVIVIR